MALSEIEKLERRYAENPQGLTFAPLAEVHRKNGEVKRALDLLGPGLQHHPDYIPASIVLGRCHMDLGDVQAAETAFLHVLSLDGENVIALKALGDISERLLKFDDAERWLNTLLTLDRSNDDAREQLQRVEIARRQAEVASSAEPSSVADAEPPPAIASPAIASPAFEPPVAEPAVGWVSHAGPVDDPHAMNLDDLEPSSLDDLEPSTLRDLPIEPSAMQFEEPTGFQDTVEPIDGLVGREVDTPDELGDEFRVETSEDIVLNSAGGSEFQMPDASQELFASGARGKRGPFEEDTPVTPRPAAAAPASEVTPEPMPTESTASGSTAHDLASAEPMMSDAAAFDLGLADLPRADHSAAESGASEGLSASSAPEAPAAPEPSEREATTPPELAGSGAMAAPWDTEPITPGGDQVSPAEPATSMASELADSRPEPDFRYPRRNEDRPAASAPAVPRRSYAAGETGGHSVAQLFQGILSARPPIQAPAPAVRQPQPGGGAGAPTRPAADTLSLSSVFGEEGSDTPPAVPATGSGSGSVSFDDFFGSSPAAPSARTPRTPDPKSDDLDQFHAWLQNLKR